MPAKAPNVITESVKQNTHLFTVGATLAEATDTEMLLAKRQLGAVVHDLTRTTQPAAIINTTVDLRLVPPAVLLIVVSITTTPTDAGSVAVNLPHAR